MTATPGEPIEAELKRPLARLTSVLDSPWGVVAGVITVYGAFIAYKGVHVGPDSRAYTREAVQLIGCGFDYGAYFEVSLTGPSDSFFVSVCALLMLVLGQSWTLGVALMNLSCAAGVGVFLLRWLERAGVERKWRRVAIVGYLLAFDVMVWVKGVLTDPLFLLTVTGIAYLLSARQLRARALLVLSPLLVGAHLMRASAVALVPIVALTALLRWLGAPGVSRRTRWVSTIVLVCVAEAGLLVFAHYMQRPKTWPLGLGSQQVSYVAGYYAQGQVQWKRYETYHDPPQTLWDFHAITLDRLWYFFRPFADGWSVSHKIYNLAFYLPVYLGCLLLLSTLASGAATMSEDSWRALAPALSTIVVFALLQSMMQVDFGWRYRLPIVPALLLTAAAGASAVASIVNREYNGSQKLPHNQAPTREVR